jgi:hypothetical protein
MEHQMTKTISQKLREFALNSKDSSFCNILHDDAWEFMAYRSVSVGDPLSFDMTDTDRRMFILFVAESLESEQ